MFSKFIESCTKLCPFKMRNLVLLRNDHSSFTRLQILHSPFIPKEHKQKEITVHGLHLAIWDLISTKGNYSEVSWTLVESGCYLGAPEPWATTSFRHSRASRRYKQPGYRNRALCCYLIGVLEVHEGGYKPGGNKKEGLAQCQRPPEPVCADLSGDLEWAPSRDGPTFRLEWSR